MEAELLIQSVVEGFKVKLLKLTQHWISINIRVIKGDVVKSSRSIFLIRTTMESPPIALFWVIYGASPQTYFLTKNPYTWVLSILVKKLFLAPEGLSNPAGRYSYGLLDLTWPKTSIRIIFLRKIIYLCIYLEEQYSTYKTEKPILFLT